MPILKNIKAAENEAEVLRENANKEVESLIEKTRKAAENEAKEIMKQANDTIESNNQETETLIMNMEKENLENIHNEKLKLDGLAKENEKVGIDYILKKVIDI